MKNAFKVLLLDTINKEIRNKTFLFAIILSTISIFIGYSLAKLMHSFGSTNEMNISATAVNLMMYFLNIWGVIISVFFGVSALRSDFQNNIIYQYLTFPISRNFYYFTRLIGSWIMVYGFYLYSYILIYVLFYSLFKGTAITMGQLYTVLLMGIYTFVYLALTFIVSLFLGRIGAFFTMLFVAFLITYSNMSFGLLTFSEMFKELSISSLLNLVVYFLLPHLGVLSSISSALLIGNQLEYNLYFEIPHLFLSTLFVIFLSTRILKLKDF
jgi:hypothetical protein